MPSGLKVAVKKLDKIQNYKILDIFRREIAIHKKLKHPNILRLYTCLEDSKFFYLLLEYTSEGNLFNWIKKCKSFNENEAAFFFIQTVVGFYYMHKNGFIHRDLKPENLLVFKNDQTYSVKICDFTWTLELEEKLEGMDERKTFCGTFEYMAPEMLNEESHNY